MIQSIRIITLLVIVFSIRTFEARAEPQDWRTQVESAIQSFSLDQTQFLFAKPEAAMNMNATNSFDETVLFRLVRGIAENKNIFHVPIEQGWLDLVRICLEKGADPNAPSEGYGRTTALIHAIEGGLSEVTDLLLSAKASISTDAVFAAVANVSILKKLASHGVDLVAVRSELGQTLLHSAVFQHNEVANYLLSIPGFPFDLPDSFGRTPFYNALGIKNFQVANQLLDLGAMPNPETSQGDGLTRAFIVQNDAITLKMLSKIQSIPDVKHTHFLRTAALGGNVEIIQRLLDLGADPSGCGALHAAAYRNHLSALSILIEAGSNPNLRCNWFGGQWDPPVTPLELSLMGGDFPEIINSLIKSGAQLAGEVLAVTENRVSAAQMLYSLGGNFAQQVNAPGVSRGTLHWAASDSNLDMLKFLLSIHIDPNWKDAKNCTPIHYTGNVEKLLALLEAGADPNAICDSSNPGWHQGNGLGEKGNTALIYLTQDANLNAAKVLLSNHANPNHMNDAGETPLIALFAQGYRSLEASEYIATVQSLVARGANINLVRPGGETPLTLARKRNYLRPGDQQQVVNTLIALGAHD